MISIKREKLYCLGFSYKSQAYIFTQPTALSKIQNSLKFRTHMHEEKGLLKRSHHTIQEFNIKIRFNSTLIIRISSKHTGQHSVC